MLNHKLTKEELDELKAICKKYSEVSEHFDSWCMATFKEQRPPRIIRLFDKKIVRLWYLFNHVVDAFDWEKVG